MGAAVTLSESELVASLRAGDAGAVEVLIDRYWERTYRVAVQWVGDPGAAEDVTQETFVRALRKARDVRQPASFRSWLFRVLEGTARQHVRSQGRRRRYEGSWQPGGDEGGPADAAEQAETSARVRAELAELPETVRQVLVLRFYEDQSLAEVAEHLSLPRPTVSSHIRRGLARLRHALGAAALAGVALPGLIQDACAAVPVPAAPSAVELLAKAAQTPAEESQPDPEPTPAEAIAAPTALVLGPGLLAGLVVFGLATAVALVLAQPLADSTDSEALPGGAALAPTGGATADGSAAEEAVTTLPAGPLLAPADEAATDAVPAAPPAEPTVTLRMVDVTVPTVLAEIERQTGVRVETSDGFEDPLSLWVRDMPASEAVETVAALAHGRLRGDADAPRLEPCPRVTIQFTDANVRTLLQLAAAYSGKQIHLPEDLSGNVTLDLEEVDWDLAVVAIANVLGYATHGNDDQLWVLERGAPAPPDSELLTLANLAERLPKVHASPLQPGAAERASGLVSLPPEALALGVLAEELSVQTGRRLLVEDPALHQSKFSIPARGVPWERVLLDLLPTGEAQVDVRGDTLVLTPRRVTSVEFEDANVRTILQLLAAYAELNCVIHPGVTGSLSLQLDRLPWNQAVLLVADSVGAKVHRCGNVLLVAPPGALDLDADLAPSEPWSGGDLARLNLRGPFKASAFVDAVYAQTQTKVRVLGAPREPINLNLSNASLHRACQTYAQAAGLELRRDRGEYVIAPPAGRVRFHVYGAPIRPLLSFVAARGKIDVVIRSTVSGEVVGPRAPYGSHHEALQACLELGGARLEPRPGGGIVSGAGARPAPGPTDAEPQTPARLVQSAGGEANALVLPLQAVDLQDLHPERSAVLLGGRHYRVGEALIDPETEEEVAVRVTAIEADRVLLDFYTRGFRRWLIAERTPEGWTTRAQIGR